MAFIFVGILTVYLTDWPVDGSTTSVRVNWGKPSFSVLVLYPIFEQADSGEADVLALVSSAVVAVVAAASVTVTLKVVSTVSTSAPLNHR